jgi:rubredoxin
MLVRRIGLAALAGLLALSGLTLAQTQDPYGSIADLKLANPEDGQDMPSVKPPQGAIVLFDGSSLDNWLSRNGKDPAKWKILEGGILQVERGTGDIVTKQKFDGRFKLHVEFRVPYEPKNSGQGRGNSGVYLQGRYEVQVLDSYGIPADKLGQGDCGGIYGVAKPPVNACKAPTVWQTYDIDFQSPVCKDGKPVEPGVITVVFNGVKIHDHVRIAKKDKEGKEEIVTVTTSGLASDPCTPGPILLQDHGNPVQYRNIWLVPSKE